LACRQRESNGSRTEAGEGGRGQKEVKEKGLMKACREEKEV
jgi:hypothetical protein